MAKKIVRIVLIIQLVFIILPFILAYTGFEHAVFQSGLHWGSIFLLYSLIPTLITLVRIKKGHNLGTLFYFFIGIVSFLIIVSLIPYFEFFEMVIS